jgi:hypothetical protein
MNAIKMFGFQKLSDIKLQPAPKSFGTGSTSTLANRDLLQ